MAERESAQVYISYSRKDNEFARRLVDRFDREQINVWVDWKDIPAGSEWDKEIQQGIENSDVFVFLLSPDSLKSEINARELKIATDYNKRLLPVVVRDIEPRGIPMQIASINWIYMREKDDFESAIPKLIQVIQMDYTWIKEHTRLLTLSLDWEKNNKESSYLLRGQNYQETMQAATKNSGNEPFLNPLQQEYLLASQQANRGLFERFGFNANQASKVQSNDVEFEGVVEPEVVQSVVEEIQLVEVGKLFSVSTDQASGVDQLNYSRFADAFATLIKNPEAKTPITIGIYGQWGSGKSFLMKKIKEALEKDQQNSTSTWFGRLLNSIRRLFRKKDEAVETIVIEFNAWVYSGSEHLWAGLVTHLYREVEKYFGLRMQLYRLMKATRRLFPKTIGVFFVLRHPGVNHQPSDRV